MRVLAITAAALHVCVWMMLVVVVLLVAGVPSDNPAIGDGMSAGWLVLCAALIGLASWIFLGAVMAGSIKFAAVALAVEFAATTVVLAFGVGSSVYDYGGILEFGAALGLPPMIAVWALVAEWRSE